MEINKEKFKLFQRASRLATEAKGYLELAGYLPRGTKNRINMLQRWADTITEIPAEYRQEAIGYSMDELVNPNEN